MKFTVVEKIGKFPDDKHELMELLELEHREDTCMFYLRSIAPKSLDIVLNHLKHIGYRISSQI